MTSTETWNVEIMLFEGDDNTAARATLISGTGANRRRTLVGTGRAHRKASDPAIPEIGAEIATARALRDLADRLLGAASDDIADIEQHEVHLVR
ncbi:dsRBD fold-containing protein [Kineosporia sp. R_H_3]|uniref:dsRBD fold-containing protein n=1 Tax=Kineosporia sp. R_H_3 TaxID=1961848 RepID=UPI000B4B06B4|nr:dsRBD fold-containing protein [Kineosporia sp. R_H_3]